MRWQDKTTTGCAWLTGAWPHGLGWVGTIAGMLLIPLAIPGLAAPSNSGGPPTAATITTVDRQAKMLVDKMASLRQSSNPWIEINLSTQRLIAWEGNQPVYGVIVSTGKASTPTLPGVFAIREKRSIDRMVGEDYDVPDVPFAMYYSGGYAIHGAYWHHDFGTPVSHGCTNVAVNHARWLFDWAPVGTPIVIHGDTP